MLVHQGPVNVSVSFVLSQKSEECELQDDAKAQDEYRDPGLSQDNARRQHAPLKGLVLLLVEHLSELDLGNFARRAVDLTAGAAGVRIATS